MLAYLAGAIEYSPDLGRGWRTEIAPSLIAVLAMSPDLTPSRQYALSNWIALKFDMCSGFSVTALTADASSSVPLPP